jgi:hypothetical protein
MSAAAEGGMDEARVAEIRERAAAASVPDDEQLVGDGYLGYDVTGIPGGIRYAFERHEDYEFLLHARADVLALLDALAAREGEAARLREALAAIAGGPTTIARWCAAHGVPITGVEMNHLRADIAERALKEAGDAVAP